MTAQVVPFNPFFLHTSPTGTTTTHSQEVLVVPVLPTTNHMELDASVALHLQLTRPPHLTQSSLKNQLRHHLLHSTFLISPNTQPPPHQIKY